MVVVDDMSIGWGDTALATSELKGSGLTSFSSMAFSRAKWSFRKADIWVMSDRYGGLPLKTPCLVPTEPL